MTTTKFYTYIDLFNACQRAMESIPSLVKPDSYRKFLDFTGDKIDTNKIIFTDKTKLITFKLPLNDSERIYFAIRLKFASDVFIQLKRHFDKFTSDSSRYCIQFVINTIWAEYQYQWIIGRQCSGSNVDKDLDWKRIHELILESVKPITH
ncbi:MAG: hypothetical protein ACLSCR_03910 [Akkermansia sp.]|jgi:hypothetical protein|uniref:hypothetical protein n=1 Tax=Akkermansia sp. TaxID=1872421 RepID=UPI003A27B39B